MGTNYTQVNFERVIFFARVRLCNDLSDLKVFLMNSHFRVRKCFNYKICYLNVLAHDIKKLLRLQISIINLFSNLNEIDIFAAKTDQLLLFF